MVLFSIAALDLGVPRVKISCVRGDPALLVAALGGFLSSGLSQKASLRVETSCTVSQPPLDSYWVPQGGLLHVPLTRLLRRYSLECHASETV